MDENNGQVLSNRKVKLLLKSYMPVDCLSTIIWPVQNLWSDHPLRRLSMKPIFCPYIFSKYSLSSKIANLPTSCNLHKLLIRITISYHHLWYFNCMEFLDCKLFYFYLDMLSDNILLPIYLAFISLTQWHQFLFHQNLKEHLVNKAGSIWAMNK